MTKEWEISYLKCRREFTYTVFQDEECPGWPQTTVSNPRYTFVIEEKVFIRESKRSTISDLHKHKTDKTFRSPVQTSIDAQKTIQGMKQEIQERLKELTND